MSPRTHVKPRRWPATLAAALISLGAGLSAAFLSPGPKPRVIWDASSGVGAPNEFLFLMVPASPLVALYDAPGGVRIGVLDRAMLNTLGEVQQGAWFSLGGRTPRPFVSATDLRFAESDADLPWLAALNEAMKSEPIIEFARSVRVAFEPHADRVGVVVSVDLGRRTEIYAYEVVAGRAFARAMKQVSLGAELDADAAALRSGVVVSVATAVGAALLLRHHWRRQVRISH